MALTPYWKWQIDNGGGKPVSELNETVKIQNDITGLLKSYIDNLDDRYQKEVARPSLSNETRAIIADTIERELQEVAVAISKLETSRVLTPAHYLTCMVLLAEVKSNFIKLSTWSVRNEFVVRVALVTSG